MRDNDTWDDDERWWTTPYYNPELWGLKLIGSVERDNAPYQFNLVAVWQDPATGKLYYDFDSGCSCPQPFERVKEIADLQPIHDYESFAREVNDWLRGYSDLDAPPRPAAEVAVQALLREVRELL
jgi:hypothetical protein